MHNLKRQSRVGEAAVAWVKFAENAGLEGEVKENLAGLGYAFED